VSCFHVFWPQSPYSLTSCLFFNGSEWSVSLQYACVTWPHVYPTYLHSRDVPLKCWYPPARCHPVIPEHQQSAWGKPEIKSWFVIVLFAVRFTWHSFPEQRLHGRGMNSKNTDKVQFSKNDMIAWRSDDGHYKSTHLLQFPKIPNSYSSSKIVEENGVLLVILFPLKVWKRGFRSAQTNFVEHY
jgi:hypothetical protein